MSIHVDTGELKQAGHSMKAAAAGSSGADPRQDLDPIPGALPGSTSGPAAKSLTSAWDRQFSRWRKDAEDFGQAMIDLAEEYQAADHRAKARSDVVRTKLPSDGGPAASRPGMPSQTWLHKALGGK